MLNLLSCLSDVAAALLTDEVETPAAVPDNKTTKFEKRLTKEEIEEEQRSVFSCSLNPSTEAIASLNNTQQLNLHFTVLYFTYI